MNASRPSVHPIEAPPPQTNGAAEHPMPQGRMEDIPGMAGTRGGLTLRLYQFAFAVISLCVMTTTSYFSVVSAFRIRYLLCQLPCCCCQFAKLWSLSLAMIDFHAILVKRSLRNAKVVSLFAIGDAITSTLTFSAALVSQSCLAMI